MNTLIQQALAHVLCCSNFCNLQPGSQLSGSQLHLLQSVQGQQRDRAALGRQDRWRSLRPHKGPGISMQGQGSSTPLLLLLLARRPVVPLLIHWASLLAAMALQPGGALVLDTWLPLLASGGSLRGCGALRRCIL